MGARRFLRLSAPLHSCQTSHPARAASTCDLVFSCSSFSSPSAGHRRPPRSRLRVRGVRTLSELTWTERDGMPHNAVLALATTRDGYLWVGTYEGLARFDG